MSLAPQPPPLPARAKRRGPVPSPAGLLTTKDKLSIATLALQLRDEQVDARIVHYKAELATSPELDAITASVVAELRAAQQEASGIRKSVETDQGELEIELIDTLKRMLSRLFRPGELALAFERKLSQVSKRFAKLFFESELAERTAGNADEQKAVRSSDQLLYYVFSRKRDELAATFAEYPNASDSARKGATEALDAFIRDAQHEFLSRHAPELNRLVRLLNESLSTFLTKEFPDHVAELAWQVVKEAKLGQTGSVGGYKIPPSSFDAFRKAFEKRFLERLVPSVEEKMLRAVRESETPFREETLYFVAQPEIFANVCDVLCGVIYDMLYFEGFLDLPEGWRKAV